MAPETPPFLKPNRGARVVTSKMKSNDEIHVSPRVDIDKSKPWRICWKMLGRCWKLVPVDGSEILRENQLRLVVLSHYLRGLTYLRWLFGISAINRIRDFFMGWNIFQTTWEDINPQLQEWILRWIDSEDFSEKSSMDGFFFSIQGIFGWIFFWRGVEKCCLFVCLFACLLACLLVWVANLETEGNSSCSKCLVISFLFLIYLIDLLSNVGFEENHVGVSKTSGTPKWMVYSGTSY